MDIGGMADMALVMRHAQLGADANVRMLKQAQQQDALVVQMVGQAQARGQAMTATASGSSRNVDISV